MHCYHILAYFAKEEVLCSHERFRFFRLKAGGGQSRSKMCTKFLKFSEIFYKKFLISGLNFKLIF